MRYNLIFLSVIAMMFSITLVSALGEVSNSIDANASDVVISNWWNMPLISSEVANATLITPHYNIVPVGDGVEIAEFNVTSLSNTNDLIKNINLFNVKDRNVSIQRDYTLAVKTVTSAIRPTYSLVCPNTLYPNGTLMPCYDIQNGTESYQNIQWHPVDTLNMNTGESATVGIFMNMYIGDVIEWIPNIAGADVTQWAITASDSLLHGYYTFNASSGTVAVDSILPQHNLTVVQNWTTGIKANALWTSGSAGTDSKYNLSGNTGFTFNAWVNRTSSDLGNSGSAALLASVNSGINPSNNGDFGFWNANCGSAVALGLDIKDATTRQGIGNCTTVTLNQWTMITLTINTTNAYVYWNGTVVYKYALNYGFNALNNLTFFSANGGSFFLANLIVDEMGIWNRSITPAEVTQLYNSGSGLFYPFFSAPVISLLYPANNQNITQTTSKFNATISSGGGTQANTTLYLWYSNSTVIQSVFNTTSGSGDITQNYSLSGLPDGNLSWNVFGCNNMGCSWATSNNTFSVSTIPSNITFVAPTDANNSNLSRNYVLVNVTAFNSLSTDLASINNSIYNSTGIVYSQTLSSSPNYVNFTNLPDGNYSFNSTATSINGAKNYTPTYFVQIDTSAPVITNLLPYNHSYIFPVNQTYSSFSINATTSDAHLAYCWLNSTFNNTLTFVTCNANTQLNLTNISGTQTINYYSNDSLGHTNHIQTTISLPSVQYNSTAHALSQEGFALNLSLFDGLTPVQMNLVYNNTLYPSTISIDSAGNYIGAVQLVVPVSSSTISFYWNNLLSNGSVLNSSVYNQSISSVSIDDCSVNTLKILNLTMYDEDTNAYLNITGNNFTVNGTIAVTAKLYSSLNPNTYISYSTSKTNTNPVSLCVPAGNLTGVTYSMDADIQYVSTNHVTRWNYVRNYQLSATSAPDNVILRDLLILESQEFKITYKDATFLLVPNVVIDIEKYYVGSGTYLTVENGLTDSYGTTIGHFVLGTNSYLINVYRNGVLLSTYPNLQPVCNNIATGDCEINLAALASSYQFTNWLTYNNLNYFYNFSEANRQLGLTWSLQNITSGNSRIQLNVIQQGFFGNSTICSFSSTGTFGAYTCNINQSFGNSTIEADLFKDGNFVSTNLFTITNGEQAAFGNTGIILGFVFVITLALMFTSSPTMSIIGGVFGLIVVGLLNLINFANNNPSNSILAYSSGIVWIVVAAVAIVWKMNKSTGGTA